MRILKNLGKVDATFDQSKGFNRLLELPNVEQYYSFDLRKASDRLPVAMQLCLLSSLYGKVISGL
jgi:hypothetical protein